VRVCQPAQAEAATPARDDAGGVTVAIGAARAETPTDRPRPALPATPEQRAEVRKGARRLGLNADQLGVLA
jgi:hypothetical protein